MCLLQVFSFSFTNWNRIVDADIYIYIRFNNMHLFKLFAKTYLIAPFATGNHAIKDMFSICKRTPPLKFYHVHSTSDDKILASTRPILPLASYTFFRSNPIALSLASPICHSPLPLPHQAQHNCAPFSMPMARANAMGKPA